MPKDVERIIADLEDGGFEAYAVGGCVRDSLMGRKPKDWDVTTSATPADVKSIFRNTYDTGIEHGTVSVRFGTAIYEVTTFRIDGDYSDHRRPDAVRYTNQLAQDLRRRDFTMNAMAYHPSSGIIDLFGGQEDIARKCIRCVGEPRERFEEDALRMLRAYRFAARFGFEIEAATQRAVKEKAPLLVNVSRERVREEMDRLLLGEYPGVLRQLAESGLMNDIIPEFMACLNVRQNTPYHIYPVAEHMIRAVEAAPPVRALRWAALLHDIAKPQCRTTDAHGRDHFWEHPAKGAEMAEQILRRLKFDNETREAVVRMVRLHDTDPPGSEREMRYLLNRLPDGFYPYLLALQAADAAAQNPQMLPLSRKKLDQAQELYQKVVREGQCVKLADLAVNGSDLQKIGYPRGRAVGEVLSRLMRQVLDRPEINQRELLLEVAQRLRKDPAVEKYLQ